MVANNTGSDSIEIGDLGSKVKVISISIFFFFSNLLFRVTNSDGIAAMLYHVVLPMNALYKLEVNCSTYFKNTNQEPCCHKIQVR